MALASDRTITRHAYTEGETPDARGNVAKTWSAGTEVAVGGWATTTTDELTESGREAGIERLSVYGTAANLSVFSPRDRATVDGVLYELDGPVSDYSHSPFTPALDRAVIVLKRIEG